MSPWRALGALSLLAGCLKAPLPLPEDDAGMLDVGEVAPSTDAPVDAPVDGRESSERGGGLADVPTVPTCVSPQRLCAGQCRDVERDPMNCGSCSRMCDLNGAIATCDQGLCTIEMCRSGFGNCDGSPANGCEVDLTTDAHCGGCDTRCAASMRCSSIAGTFMCLM
jgi:hypothetical protein